MGTHAKFPLTHDELAPLLDADGFARFPATFAEYWEVLEHAEYRADFYQNEIIATMSYEADLHSKIVTELLFLLKTIFRRDATFTIHNSNRPLCIPACNHAVFNPDGSVVSQPPVYFQYKPGMNAETTPVVLFEVLSKTTRRYDLKTKLPCYQQIPSLRCLFYVEALHPEVTVWTRQENAETWTETTLTQTGDSFAVGNGFIYVRDIYTGIYF